jgi:hypothetical protein
MSFISKTTFYLKKFFDMTHFIRRKRLYKPPPALEDPPEIEDSPILEDPFGKMLCQT